MKRLIIVIILITLALAGCANTIKKDYDPENLHDLEILSDKSAQFGDPTISKIRLQALKETGLTIGAQGGLAKRSGEINKMLNKNAANLDKVFNFNGIMLEDNVLPPVLEESNKSLNLKDGDTIQIADKTYKIVRQARFVTTVPNWRDYLILDYKKPEIPDKTLLPRTKTEREVWVKYTYMGWLNGINQANSIYADNLAKLKHDYEGTMLYHNLLAKHMINKPFVAKNAFGITTNEDHSKLRIDDRTMQIMSKPRLTSEGTEWQPVLIPK
jgi:defect in organelle trafficking protein DotC